MEADESARLAEVPSGPCPARGRGPRRAAQDTVNLSPGYLGGLENGVNVNGGQPGRWTSQDPAEPGVH
eukprot:3759820-Pyramimonas_sp.AAC.1